MRRKTHLPVEAFRRFTQLESAGGILLFVTAMIALVLDNSPLSHFYEYFFHIPISVHVGTFSLSKPLIHWINEGFMTIFFLLVTLEIKREIFEGELNSLSKIALPSIAAVGGMVIPALIYFLWNHDDSFAHAGWAIPTATDIAFALGIISLLGSRIPSSIKIFLTTIAIFDDIGAIAIIAVFYTSKISFFLLGITALCLLGLTLLNRLRVKNIMPYIIVGLLLWLSVLKSGVHATFAGVIIAFAIPLRQRGTPISPLRVLEEVLHPWVVFGILPLFAFANAGVPLTGYTYKELFNPLMFGVAGGLFIGKQIGIFGSTWLAVKSGWIKLPEKATWLDIYGIALICGVGFTMSLFIGTLAFPQVGTSHAALVRLGVLIGSMTSGILGYLVLHLKHPRKKVNIR